MPGSVNAGLGATLFVQISSTYVAIASVKSLSGPSMEQGSRETTLLNPAAGYRTFSPTITDPGTLDFDLFWDETQTYNQELFNMFGIIPAPSFGWKLVTSDTHTFIFSGFVSKFDLSEQTVDSNVEATMSVKISGAIAIA